MQGAQTKKIYDLYLLCYACHWLTDSRLTKLIDVTLACEDAYSKLVEVVTVADISDEGHVGNILLHIWKLRFGQKAKLLFKLWVQGLVKILKLKFRQDLKLEFGQFFSADVWLRLRSWILVKIMKLGLVKILSLSLVKMMMSGWDFKVNA